MVPRYKKKTFLSLSSVKRFVKRFVISFPFFILHKTCSTGDATFGRLNVAALDTSRPSLLHPYQIHFQTFSVLRLKCALHSVLHSNPDLGWVHGRTMLALRPSRMVQSMVDVVQEKAAEITGGTGSYVGLHLRHEQDWRSYCKSEVQNDPSGTNTGISSFEQCFFSAKDAAAVLEKRQVMKSHRVLYLATGLLSENTVKAFERLNVTVLHRKNTWASSKKREHFHSHRREIAAAIEFWTLRQSSVFFGNSFSSFSWLVRELDLLHNGRLQRTDDTIANGDGHGTRAYFYNQPAAYTEHDVQPSETIRWNVLPGVLVREKNAVKEKSTASRSTEGPPDNIKTSWMDIGFILIEARASRKLQKVVVKINGTVAGRTIANYASEGHWIAKLELPFPGRLSAKVDICTPLQDGADQPDTCSSAQASSGVLFKRGVTPEQDPTVFMYFPLSLLTTGGPEALHQLHQMINKLHSEKRISVRSVFPHGNEFYRGKHSVFSDHFDVGDITPWDYMIAPEHLGIDPVLNVAAELSGFIPIVWFVGQHVTRLSEDLPGKQDFMRIALTEYFATQHFCGLKAIINTPMNAGFQKVKT